MDLRLSSKYLCGLPIIKTCYIFAIIYSLISGLLALGCLMQMVFMFFCYHSDWIVTNRVNLSLIDYVLISVASYLATSISALFGVYLLFGIKKKNHKLVMAYFVYGIFVEIMLIVGNFMFVITRKENFRLKGCDLIYASIVIFICVFYAVVLHMVRKMFIILKYKAERNYNNVQTLCLLEVDGQMLLKEVN